MSNPIKQYQLDTGRSSRRNSEDEDSVINIKSISNPDFLRRGEDVRRTCCMPIDKKDEDVLNLDMSIDLEDEKERRNSSSHQQYNSRARPSILSEAGHITGQTMLRINSRRQSHLLHLSQMGSSKLQLLLGSERHKDSEKSHGVESRTDLEEIEKRKAETKEAALAAERHAIVKNQKYEKMFSQNKGDTKIGKINSMWGALNLVVIVASFLNQIKQYGQGYKFKQLKQADFEIIGDKSAEYSFYFDNQYFAQNQPSRFKLFWIKVLKAIDSMPLLLGIRKNIINKFHSKNTLILPNSMIKIIWDSFILILLSLNIFYVPIKITWEGSAMGGLELTQWLEIILNDLPGWTFLADMVLTFNTAFYSKGTIVYKRKRIVKNYLKTEFLIDLLTVIPFIVSLKLNLVILNAVLLFRTSKMFKLASYFEQLLNMKPQHMALFNLFKLVFMIIFVAHFCGCMFFFVGSLQIEYNLTDKTWIEAAGMVDKNWFEQYITSLYWAVITMITIGYGDITPITIYERAFVILITLLSCGVFAYSINQIGHLISALTQNSDELKGKMGLLTRHLRNRGVSHDLQMQVRKYFEYWYKGKQENEGQLCDDMIESLSNNLRQEVQNDIRYRLIGQMPILKSNFSSNFLKQLAYHIKTKRTKPEEVLIEEQQISDNLYLLVSGTVRSYISIKKDSFTQYTSMRLFKTNSIFDQVSFMGDLRCLNGYRSIGSCTLYYINKTDLLNELKNFPLDREKYQFIKDNINIYRSQRNIGTKCTYCEKYTHSFDRCPFIKYIPYSEKHITIYRASIEQIRDEHKRRENRHPTLEAFTSSKERAVNYLIENNPFQNEEELIERLELVNIGEDEFYQQFQPNLLAKQDENDEDLSTSNQLPEEDFTCNQIYPPEFQKNSIILLPLVAEQTSLTSSQQPRQTNNHLNAYSAGPVGPSMMASQAAAINQGSIATATMGEQFSQYMDGGGHNTLKNNSNLNTIFSNGDNSISPSDAAGNSQVTGANNNQNNQLNPVSGTSQDQQQSLVETIGQSNTASFIEALGGMSNIQTMVSHKNRKSMRMVQSQRSPRLKKQRAEDLAILKLRQAKETQGQVSTGGGVSVHKPIQLYPINMMRKIDENNLSNEINESTHKSSAYEKTHKQQRRLQLNKLSTAPLQQQNEPQSLAVDSSVETGILNRSPIGRKISDIQRGSVYHLSNIQLPPQQQQQQQQTSSQDQSEYLNAMRRRSSLTNNHLFNAHLTQQQFFPSPIQQQQQAPPQHQYQLQQQQITAAVSHQVIQSQSTQIGLSVQQIQQHQLPHQLSGNQHFIYSGNMNVSNLQYLQMRKEVFMPVMNLDRMKTYQVYYPSGNYTNVLEKMLTLVIRQANTKPKVYDPNKLRKSVNKIMHIRQLQNSILKKNVSNRQPTISAHQLVQPKKMQTIQALKFGANGLG